MNTSPSGSFSRRHGYNPDINPLKLDEVTDAIVNRIWNLVASHLRFFYPADGNDRFEAGSSRLAHFLADGFFSLAIDDVPSDLRFQREWTRKNYMEAVKGRWYRLYDFIEYLVGNWKTLPKRQSHTDDEFARDVNRVLEEERSGWRLRRGIVAPMTSKLEMDAVNQAADEAAAHGLGAVRVQLDAAARKLALRPEPDFRGSIKESISAVESLAKLLSGTAKGGLDLALTKADPAESMHPALRQALLKLYGYTSDEHGGIRHCLLDESRTIGLAEALFMLVACSAFVHLLIHKAEETGILK